MENTIESYSEEMTIEEISEIIANKLLNKVIKHFNNEKHINTND